MGWLEIVQNLPEPWSQWLSNATLLEPTNGVSLIVCDATTKLWINQLDIATKVFPLVRKIYPQATGLLAVSGDAYSLVGSTIKLRSIRQRLQ